MSNISMKRVKVGCMCIVTLEDLHFPAVAVLRYNILICEI